MTHITNISSLTALRFIAALMIVFVHSNDIFGILPDQLKSIPLYHGVSFFYVLSGFILTYVHSELNSSEQIWRFYFARIARIWPAHAVTFALVVIFIPATGRSHAFSEAVVNLSMLHAWIPYPEWFFSYNSVSWSISNELFFYITFPFFIQRWKQTWAIKFISAFLLVSCILISVDYFGFPPALVYINPISRLPEFLIGIGFAKIYGFSLNKFNYGDAISSLIEAIAVCFVLASLYFSPAMNQELLGNHWLVGAFATYFEVVSSTPAFAVLICVFALERGSLSRSLRLKALVLLGEISYSVYLIHQILIRYMLNELPTMLTDKSNLLEGFLIYISLVVFLSYISWKFVEKPGRKLIFRMLLNIFSLVRSRYAKI